MSEKTQKGEDVKERRNIGKEESKRARRKENKKRKKEGKNKRKEREEKGKFKLSQILRDFFG